MKLPNETSTGWIVSLVLHGILLILFVMISIPEVVQNQDFIEVIWGSPAVSKPAEGVHEQTAGPAADAAPPVIVARKSAEAAKPTQRVFLPERKLQNPAEETLPAARTEKLDVPLRGSDRSNPVPAAVGEREAPAGRSIGERDQTGPPVTSSGINVGPASGSAGAGGDIDKGVSFSIQWMKGGTRSRISGDLPKYPPGVNVEAQIKILTVVMPDGSVKSTQPAQKANTALEEAAMKEVRFWKFEPLRSAQPQMEQTCVVTFLFTLK